MIIGIQNLASKLKFVFKIKLQKHKKLLRPL